MTCAAITHLHFLTIILYGAKIAAEIVQGIDNKEQYNYIDESQS